ncbi:MAG: restriction endonuclease [Candidatus Blackburnbacteria bacterium RIFCSPHIGHO2_02_FULL_39_13]|uniref:Methyltransferase n=1 Tax=Candidatus Blackburnbacteria bacterium RIFCSPLOWO2_01_FULL_40_20 TaxID=1797519 RepID=A0A1G1VD38_9BACT|nr:MAG: restriction endonuclease [Candidatus Blackburnbacteria bacterium RIFCSPHIGHO2_02_FULL_39_13]OGY13334.1 MAG: restriction endonuclease [Candidatus Blackburnbacteria bacterium RIFCSPLOWO2_01_FULL_40_20]
MFDKYINKIIKGDCLELLKKIPDNSIDMTFADPPFNLKKKYNGYKDSLEFKEYIEWCDEWIGEMVRITKPTGSIFVHNIPKWLSYYVKLLNEHANFKHWIAWYAPTSPMGKSLQPAHYGVLFYVKDSKKTKIYEIRMPHERERKSNYLRKDYGGKKAGLHPFGPLISDVWTDIHRIKHNKYRDEHPCQLPVPLLERLILMITDEGDIVLDPFVGTGTTAVAAKKLGRKYIGFDLDDEYKRISENNLKKIQPDSKIDKSWVSFHLGEVRTIRDKDWINLSSHFEIPKDIKDIDFTKIKVKKK